MLKYFFISIVFLYATSVKSQTFTGGGGSIPDAGSQVCFPITISGVGQIDENYGLASVCLSINHSFDADLEILLKAPDGNTVQLSVQNGGAGDNYQNTCFTANAVNPIAGASAPFSGTFLPEGYLGNVNNGQAGDGEWKLCIQDKNATDAGALVSWSVTFNSTPAPPPPGCISNQSAGNTWLTAPRICNLNGFCGTTSVSFAPDTWPDLTNAFCGVIENNSFISFAATSSSISLNVWVTNSLNGNGIEMMIFSTPNVLGPVTKFACNTGIIPKASGPNLVNVTGLIPGNTYYIMIDGKQADICDYTLVAASGIDVLNISKSKNALCKGQSMQLSASGGNGTYTWSPAAGLSTVSGAAVTAAPDTTTVYTVTSTPTGGCPLVTEVTVSVKAKPDLGSDQEVSICPNGSVNLNSKFITQGLSLKWTLGGANVPNPAAVSAAGIYRLIATNISGCSDTALLTINVNLKPDLGNDRQVNVCQGSAANLIKEVSTGGLVLSWTFGGSPVPDPAAVYAAGDYQLVVTDGSQGSVCADTVIVKVAQLMRPNLGLDKDVPVCQTQLLTLAAQFDVTGLSSKWSFNGNPWTFPITIFGGFYQLIASDFNGCTDTAILVVSIKQKPALGAPKVIKMCPGMTLDLTALYNTAGLTTSWTTGGVPVTDPANITAGGEYLLTGTNTSGCSSATTVIALVDQKLNLGNDTALSLCGGLSANLTLLYETGGLSTSWTLNGVPVPIPNNINADGTYQMTADDGANCKDTVLVSVINFVKPDLGADVIKGICQNQSYNLKDAFNTSGFNSQWRLNGAWIPAATPVTNAGIYVLTVTDINGCADTARLALSVNPVLVLENDTALSFCPGEAKDLTKLYTAYYSNQWWLNGVAVSNPASVSLPGTYTLIASHATGCADTARVALTSNNKPSLGADKPLSICPGSSVGLTGQYNTTGLTTAWSLSGTLITNPSNITLGGDYQLIATNNEGCSDSAVVKVTVKPKPDLGNDKKKPLCIVDNVNIAAEYNTAGLVSNWTLNGVAVLNPASVNTEGFYQLIVTNAAGCTDTAVVSLILNPKPDLGNDTLVAVCPDQSLNLFSLFDTAGLVTSWRLNEMVVSNPSSVLIAGTYTLITSNAAGCTDTAVVELIIKNKPTLGANKSLSTCPGISVALTGQYNTTGLTTAWSLNGTAVINPSDITVGGDYELIATNSEGCSDSALVKIIIDPKPDLGSNKNKMFCPETTVNIAAEYNTAGLISDWTLNGVAVLNPASVNTEGFYQLIVANATGCTDTAVVSLILNPKPDLGNDTLVAVCPGQSLNLFSLFDTAGLVTSWRLNEKVVSNPSSVLIAGTYTLITSNAAGCADTAVVELTIKNKPTLGADKSFSTCPGISVALTGQYNTTGLTTAWSLNGTAINNPSDITVAGDYELIATNSEGCSDSALVKITIDPKPDLGSNKNKTFCPETTVNIAAEYNTAGLKSDWTLNGVAVLNPASINADGFYQLIVTNAAGCADTAVVSLILNPKPDLGNDTMLAVCSGQSLSLFPFIDTAGLITTWWFNGVLFSTPATASDAGAYEIIATNLYGCKDNKFVNLITHPVHSGGTSTIDVCINELPYLWNGNSYSATGIYRTTFNNVYGCDSTVTLYLTVNLLPAKPMLGNDTAICPGDKVMLYAGKYESYLWNNHSRDASLTAYGKGLYSVKVTDSKGCSNEAGILISELKNCEDISFPNAFSPNGDLTNDYFRPVPIDNLLVVSKYTLQIFDRYGKLVFITHDPYQKWDGKSLGKSAGTGTYAWTANYVYKGKYKRSRQGFITLIR